MLPETHLTSHSRCLVLSEWSQHRDYLGHEDLFCIVLLCILTSLKIFCFCQVHTVSVFYCASLCMKYCLGISNFLGEISGLSHSIVFLYFFALISEEGFLICPCYSLELLHSNGYIFPFLLCFLTSLLFTAICKASSDNHFAFLHFFCLGMVLITASCTMSWTSIHSSSGTLSIWSNPLNLFVTFTV